MLNDSHDSLAKVENREYAKNRGLILVQLNEINFDIAFEYARHFDLRAFARLREWHSIRTTSEAQYNKLEPWIQWPSVHTGLMADKHHLTRLGDAVHCEIPQFFEIIEAAGFSVGAISPMNCVNRLKKPAYFIPDPWTLTPSDQSWWSEALSRAISRAVNDNAKKTTGAAELIVLLAGVARFGRAKNYFELLKLALTSIRAPWRRALCLDLWLHDLHMTLFRSRSPDFSSVFFNAGAHVQHHYLFNSRPVRRATELRNPPWYVADRADPLLETLRVYDRLLMEYINKKDSEVIIATGLTQRPYDRVKFYYRLKSHREFLTQILGLSVLSVQPRMTRDFEINFYSEREAIEALGLIGSIAVDGGNETLFGDIERRGKSVSVSLVYPKMITRDTTIKLGDKSVSLLNHVVFVALKNGMHDPTGFAYFSNGVRALAPADGSHVARLFDTVLGYFGLPRRGLG